MTLAFWAVLAACFLPILAAGISKWGAKGMDNNKPREWIERQSGWRRRADWAQRNQHESLPPFIAGVMVATLTHAPQGRIDALAWIYIAIRLAYLAAYVFDAATIRSLLWTLGLACIAGLFVIGA